MGHNKKKSPNGELTIRTLAMPSDANVYGDIFGGWALSQMDIAGSILAVKRAKGRVATVAVDAMQFHLPIFVGDVLCCYSSITKIGRTSITVNVEAWVDRKGYEQSTMVTEGLFTYVAISHNRRPRPVDNP